MAIYFKTPEIKSENLVLRPLRVEDYEGIYKIRSDVENTRYVDMRPYENIERAKRFIEAVNEDIKNSLVAFWGVYLVVDEAKEILVGTVCLMDYEEQEYIAEIGYEIMREYSGQGIMIKAVEEVIDFAFKGMNLNGVCAETHINNEPSIRLLKKLNFKVEKKDNKRDMTYYFLYRR